MIYPKIFLSIAICFGMLLGISINAQKQFLNMNSTPESCHEYSLSMLRSCIYKFERKEKKTKIVSFEYYTGIAALYANLGESSDTVFHYIDLYLKIDLKFGCVLIFESGKYNER
jgi:hypothetical protein